MKPAIDFVEPSLGRALLHPVRRWRVLAVAAMIPALAPSGQAAVREAWVQRYDHVVSNATEYAVKVVRDPAGDIVVTGISEIQVSDDGTRPSIVTVKYSGVDGSLLWQRRYSGPVNVDRVAALAVDGSGNVVVAGHSYNLNWNADLYTAKYAAADGTVLWEKRYDGATNSDDYATAVAVDVGGNVVVTGYSSGSTGTDYYTAKYAAANGALLWERRYNGPANGGDVAQAVALDQTGNAVVTGSSYNGYPRYGYDIYTAKYAAANGALLWEKRHHTSAESTVAWALALDRNGDVVVIGASADRFSSDFFTAKFAGADGTLLWEKRYDGPGNNYDWALALAVDASGNAVVTGYSSNSSVDSDFYTAKYAAADGALLWERRYDGPAHSLDSPAAVGVDGGGNVVVTGYSIGSESGYGYTAKYAAADGTLLWQKSWPSGAATALTVDSTGTVVASGFFGNGPPNYDADFFTAKYAADGTLCWEQRYNGTEHYDDTARGAAVDDGGNIVVTGSSRGGASGNDFYTAKYAAADGRLLWDRRFDGPVSTTDFASAVAVDGNGNVVVTGVSDGMTDEGSYSHGDYYTAKYAAADGALLWENRYNGPANGSDVPTALAVDKQGKAIVTGYSVGNGSSWDYYTAKYAAVDGALLWERRYNGPANHWDVATALAADAAGNAVVTGWSWSSEGGFDIYTAKYAAADGSLLWERRYDGPGDSSDAATSVAVDGSGNVIVTGYSSDASISASQFYTAKYAAANGALLWERRYPERLESDFVHTSRAVAVDAEGNVVVTGRSDNGDFNADYYTAKYAAADGALLWEKRYNGPANGDDYATAVRTDDRGNVVVSGSSHNGADFDYYTAKYAAADGALLWEKRYDGPANKDDTAAGLALGPNGTVVVTGSSVEPGGTHDFATVVYRENRPPAAVATVSPPIAIRPRDANLYILAPDNTAATVVLDGSQTTDADNDPLQFSWFADGQTNVLATGTQVTHQFVVGPHTVRLLVNDGFDIGSAQIRFEVITPAGAVGQLVSLTEDASLGTKSKQPLLGSLTAAAASFDRADYDAARNQLTAFQNKVRAQLASSDAALANDLLAAAQRILDAVGAR